MYSTEKGFLSLHWEHSYIGIYVVARFAVCRHQEMALLIALCSSASLHAMTCNHSVWAKYPVFFLSKFHDSRVMANILKGVDNWVGLQNYCFLSTSSPPPSIYLILTELAVPPQPAGFFFSTATASLQVNIKKRKEKSSNVHKKEKG